MYRINFSDEKSFYGLLHEIIEGRVTDMTKRGRQRVQMLLDLSKCNSYVAVKRATDNRQE